MAERLAGISSMATGPLLAALAQAYKSETGNQIGFESVGGVTAAERVAGGEPFDVVVLASGAIAQLIASGDLLADSRIDLVRSSTGIAMKSGEPPASIDSAAALRATLEASSSIGYSTGPSGQAVLRLLANWGITPDSQKPRLVQARPGMPVGQLIADGEVTIGFQQLSEFTDLNGIQVLGPMPPGLEIETVFSGVVCRSASQPAGARRFLQWAGGGSADTAKRRHGMIPC